MSLTLYFIMHKYSRSIDHQNQIKKGTWRSKVNYCIYALLILRVNHPFSFNIHAFSLLDVQIKVNILVTFYEWCNVIIRRILLPFRYIWGERFSQYFNSFTTFFCNYSHPLKSSLFNYGYSSFYYYTFLIETLQQEKKNLKFIKNNCPIIWNILHKTNNTKYTIRRRVSEYLSILSQDIK